MIRWTPLLAWVVLIAAICAANAAETKGEEFEQTVLSVSSQLGDLAKFKAATHGLASDARNCRPWSEGEPQLYYDDLKRDVGMTDLAAQYQRIYSSDKRLAKRVYWNERLERFESPFVAEDGGPIAVPEIFIRSVIRHIERALELHYVNWVFMGDMGHSHYFIPNEVWEAKYSRYPRNRLAQFWEAAVADPRVKFLYHTAEYLHMLEADSHPVDDPVVRWRLKTRNLVGDNRPDSDLITIQATTGADRLVAINTAGPGDFPGYEYGAGFLISANEHGCFAYESAGKTVHFDISWYDLTSLDNN